MINVLAGGKIDHVNVNSGGVLNVAGTVVSNDFVAHGGVENVLAGGVVSGSSGAGTGNSGTVNVQNGGERLHQWADFFRRK